MEPQVFYSVCYNDKNPAAELKARHTFSPAVLHGYCRHRVAYCDYPGMIEDAGHSVFGMVVTGITRANLVELDYLFVCLFLFLFRRFAAVVVVGNKALHDYRRADVFGGHRQELHANAWIRTARAHSTTAVSSARSC